VVLYGRPSRSPSGQSHLIFGTGSTGCITTSRLSKLCRADALNKPLENLDAIALRSPWLIWFTLLPCAIIKTANLPLRGVNAPFSLAGEGGYLEEDV